MAEIPDVIPGEPIEASWGNPIRDRTAQRYPTEAQRDVDNPVPVDGELAFIEATSVLQLRAAGVWVDLQTLVLGDTFWLRLDATNGPLTGPLDVQGNVRINANDATFRQLSPDGSLGYELAAAVNDGGLGEWTLRRENGGTALLSVDPSGRIRVRSAVAASAVRNTHQSLNVDPVGGDGIDGDVWLTYS